MNKYQKWYNRIVAHWIEQGLKYRTKGTARHHIKPVATFDEDTPKSIINAPSNLVVVPHRVHFILHRLYAKFDITGTQWYSIWRMAHDVNSNKMKISSRVYAMLENELRVRMSKNTKKHRINPNSTLSLAISSPQCRAKMSKTTYAQRADPNSVYNTQEYRINFLRASKNPERCAKISKANSGHNNPSFDKTIYHFRNIKTNMDEKCPQYDLRIKYALNQGAISAVVRGKNKKHKNWVCLGVVS